LRSKKCTIQIFYLKRYSKLIVRLAVFAIATPADPTPSGIITKSCYKNFLALSLSLRASFCRIDTILETVLAVFVVEVRFLAGALRTGLLAIARSLANCFAASIASFFAALIAFNRSFLAFSCFL
jgi:uncharacterized membrane protein